MPRHPGDAVRAGLAAALLVVLAVIIHRDRVGLLETDVFRVFNDLPALLFGPLWLVMQLGNIGAVPVVAGIAAAFRRFRLAAAILLAGVGVWLIAKVVKTLVQRGRPSTLLPDVHIHGAAAAGRGYLSGHAAVVFAMVTLVAPYLPRRGRHLLWAAALTVCAARLYVGSHLPLDVIGGAALGWGVASVVNLVLGAPSGRPSLRSVQRAMTGIGQPVTTLVEVDADGRRGARFFATTSTDKQLFVKVIPRDRRDHDLLYRLWVAVRDPRRRIRAPSEQVEHEALMELAAAAAGVRTPPLVAVGSTGSGTGVLVNEWVDVHPFGSADVEDGAAADLRHQVELLHGAGIAHGRLNAANVLVDHAHKVWLVDFGRARLGADDPALQTDVEDLRALLRAEASAAVTHT